MWLRAGFGDGVVQAGEGADVDHGRPSDCEGLYRDELCQRHVSTDRMRDAGDDQPRTSALNRSRNRFSAVPAGQGVR